MRWSFGSTVIGPWSTAWVNSSTASRPASKRATSIVHWSDWCNRGLNYSGRPPTNSRSPRIVVPIPASERRTLTGESQTLQNISAEGFHSHAANVPAHYIGPDILRKRGRCGVVLLPPLLSSFTITRVGEGTRKSGLIVNAQGVGEP